VSLTCQPAALYPPGIFLVPISVRGSVDSRAIVRLERLRQLKNQLPHWYCRQGMDWILGLLTTVTHHTELRVITALTLISALYKSLGQAKSSQSSLVVSWQRIYNNLTVTTAHTMLCFHSRTSNSQLLTISLPSLFSYSCRAQLHFAFFFRALSVNSADLGSLYSLRADPTENTFS
jgi:hypothetical protein